VSVFIKDRHAQRRSTDGIKRNTTIFNGLARERLTLIFRLLKRSVNPNDAIRNPFRSGTSLNGIPFTKSGLAISQLPGLCSFPDDVANLVHKVRKIGKYRGAFNSRHGLSTKHGNGSNITMRVEKLLISTFARKILFLIVPFHGNGNATGFGVQVLTLGSSTTSQNMRSDS